MTEDWQDSAFGSRHIPHGRGGKAGGRNGGDFDVRKLYGVYELQGSVIDKVLTGSGKRAVLEIHGLTESGDGLVGSLEIAGALKGMLILAGSRRTLERNIKELTESESVATPSSSDEEEDEDDAEPFEKNTFRSPKFWAQWRAQVSADSDEGKVLRGQTDRCYFVFAGNDCRKLQGTINCPSLGWKNAAIKGRQITSKATNPHGKWKDIVLADD